MPNTQRAWHDLQHEPKRQLLRHAVSESFFARLKSEWVNHERYRSRAEAIQSIFYYIEIFYNRKRRHSSIDYATPQEYEALPLAA
jgi:putative transposase